MSERKQDLIKSLEYMILARTIDTMEQEYTARGEAFFHVSGRGHEGFAVVNSFLEKQDYVHAHYRDKALLLARGVTSYEYFLALFNKNESHSRGRQMNAHMSSREHNVFGLVGPVGNSQLQAVGAAAVIVNEKDNPIVISSVGDGTTSQGEFIEGLMLSIRDNLPVITVVEDNNYAISTFTRGKTFFQVGDKEIQDFMGCPIQRINGRNPQEIYDGFEKIIGDVRTHRGPAIVVVSIDRLDSHTNADDHKVYRSKDEIATIQKSSDPIVRLIMHVYEEDEIKAQKRLDQEIEKIMPALRKEVEKAQAASEPEANFSAKMPLPDIIAKTANEDFEEGSETMISSINNVLDHWLEKDERVFLYGEDLEDPKGDVFGVTKGLSTAYPNRVVNSPLSESLIVGSSVGRALVGQRPVAFLQFADFIPLVVNQLYSELGCMYWRTDGSWQAPVIIMASCGGYKPGLGPFHAASFEALVAHIPGIDVYVPSNAADAAGLLNAAFLSERPSVFFYPKNLLNTKVRNISSKSARTHLIEPGKARIVEEGQDISIVGYGNTVPLCEKVAKSLRDVGKSAELIDLRSVSPLDHETIIKSVKKTGHLLVTHEENGTMGVGAEIIARVIEKTDMSSMRRVTRRDTHVPCFFANQLEVLPSYKKILDEAVDMLGGSIEWEKDIVADDGITTIEAVGSSPSDETFTVIEWKIKVGDTIKSGELIAEAEANKAEVSVKSIVSGVVKDILVEEGATVDIGAPIALITTSDKVVKTVTREESGTPHITWFNVANSSQAQSDTEVYIGYHSSELGSNVISNEKLSELSPEWDPKSIEASTGIVSRHWLGDEQTLPSMTANSARKTLKKAGLKITDISGIICATGTNPFHTPSLAAMVQYELLQDIADEEKRLAYSGYAYDVSAACSGFVYALSNAYNRIKVNPNEKILVLTGEILSKHIDLQDYQTAPIFSDAASACIVSAEKTEGSGVLGAPVLKAIGEPATTLTVHTVEPIHMDGIKVYKVAVDNLRIVAEFACKTNNLQLSDIDLIVPHQANLKIIKGVARRLKIEVDKFYVNIDTHGNSSSCTIPICLDELADAKQLKGKRIMLIAFGGGYTFGASIVQY